MISTSMGPSNAFETCPHYITASSSSKNNEYLDNLYTITKILLSEKNIPYNAERSSHGWKFEVTNLSFAMQVTGYLMQEHSYLQTRQKGVDLYVSPKTDDPDFKQCAIRIGERPPTRDDLKTCEEVYFQQYLPDHSLPKTRLIHTIATVIGVCFASYGIFQQNWWYVAGGVAGIYEAGFHSHLFVEKNIPSSAKYPKQSIYSDLRVTIQTLLNPFTQGMNRDLKKAGIRDV